MKYALRNYKCTTSAGHYEVTERAEQYLLKKKDEEKLRALHNFIKLTILSFRASGARHGIHHYQVLPRFRVKPGMTNRGVIQSSQTMKAELIASVKRNGIIQPVIFRVSDETAYPIIVAGKQ